MMDKIMYAFKQIAKPKLRKKGGKRFYRLVLTCPCFFKSINKLHPPFPFFLFYFFLFMSKDKERLNSFLFRHVPSQVSNKQKLCYRHRPDLVKNRGPDEFSAQQVQEVEKN